MTLRAFFLSLGLAAACTADGGGTDGGAFDAAAAADARLVPDGAAADAGREDGAPPDGLGAPDGSPPPDGAEPADAAFVSDGPSPDAPLDAPPDAARGPWDPDRRLLYVADEHTDQVFELYLTDLDDLGPFASRRVGTAVNGRSVGRFVWAPDGRRAVYDVSSQELYYLDLSAQAAGAPQRVTNEFPLDATGNPIGGSSFQGWSPDSRRLIYIGDERATGIYELRMVDLSGGAPSPPVRLNTDLPVDRDVVAAAWSPDGRFVAYTAIQEPGEPFHLYVVDVSGAAPAAPIRVDGAPAAPVAWYGDRSAFAWSADARWLAWIGRFDDGSWTVGAVPIGASGPGPAALVDAVPPGRTGVRELVWAPDGDWLAYRADVVAYEALQLYAADMRGTTPGAPLSVSGVPAGYVRGDPRWSPDGRKLLFSGDVETAGENDVYVTDMTGAAPGPLYLVNADLAFQANAIGRPNYRWSPDSTRVAFVAGDSPTELYIVDVTTEPPGAPRRVNQDLPFYLDVTLYDFPWSVDSRWILYRAQEGLAPELFAVDTSSSVWTQARVNAFLVLGGEVSYTGFAEPPWKWTPWANQVVYIADQQTNDRFELWWSDVNGAVRRVNGTLTPYGDVRDFELAP